MARPGKLKATSKTQIERHVVTTFKDKEHKPITDIDEKYVRDRYNHMLKGGLHGDRPNGSLGQAIQSHAILKALMNYAIRNKKGITANPCDSAVNVDTDADNHKPINTTRPLWDQLDPNITPRSLMGGERGPVGDDYGTTFAIWLKAHFMTTDPDQGLPVTQVMSAAITGKICSKKWWEVNSGKFLGKRNVNGIWMCRPTAHPVRN